MKRQKPTLQHPKTPLHKFLIESTTKTYVASHSFILNLSREETILHLQKLGFVDQHTFSSDFSSYDEDFNPSEDGKWIFVIHKEDKELLTIDFETKQAHPV